MKSKVALIVNKLMNYRIGEHPAPPSLIASRSLWDYLLVIFNRVDTERRKVEGPDRTCAEWVLRNGGAVLLKGHKNFLQDYNQLPPDGTQMRLQAIDASDSAISHHGFAHLEGCDCLERIILRNCSYIYDDALKLLSPIEKHLLHLVLAQCPHVTDKGVLHIANLTNLQTLTIADLPGVNNFEKIVQHLEKQLPNLKINNTTS